MEKKMLINAAEEEECRIAVIDNGKLEFLDRALRLRAQYKGNVYKGHVVRIEPSLQAAFVEFSPEHRAGFLPMGEIMPELYCDDETDDSYRPRPRIEDILKKDQELLVQVVKEETGKKGAALSTYISLAGRYLVLMPGNTNGGISRKIEDEEQRKRLKKIVSELKIPEGMGVIVRTAGLGHTKAELNRDLQAQLRLWKEIEKAAAGASAPCLVHQEQDVLIRSLRDNFNTDIDEVLCDTQESFERAHTFFKSTMPRYASRVKLYEGPGPILSHFKVEEQIEQLKSRRVNLPSGGWIVLEQTEAMVCVDVNSGRATQEKGIEKTAMRTNLEAATEVARQLRLRDMGGLVVIDFIDMKDTKHLRQIEKELKTAMKRDRARVEFGKLSRFCLLELSRQRLKSSNHRSVITCPRCRGTGTVQTVEAEALSVLRMLKSHCTRGTVSAIRISVPVRVARYLLNQKRLVITMLEQAYAVSITVIPDPNLDSMMTAAAPELSRRSSPPPGQFPRPLEGITTKLPQQQPARGSQDYHSDDYASRKRRRRRRRPRRENGYTDRPSIPQAAQKLPRRAPASTNHKAPIDSIGGGTPLPPERSEYGVEAPVAAMLTHPPAATPKPPAAPRRHTKTRQNSSQARGSRGKSGYTKKTSKKTKRSSIPAGLPRDEDLIHPDDLLAPPEETKITSVDLAPPVQEEPPSFPWGFASPDPEPPAPATAGKTKTRSAATKSSAAKSGTTKRKSTTATARKKSSTTKTATGRKKTTTAATTKKRSTRKKAEVKDTEESAEG